MEIFHSYSVVFKTYESRPNILITLSFPNSPMCPPCLVIFNLNAMLKGSFRDLQRNSIVSKLHVLKFATFEAEPDQRTLSLNDFISAYDLATLNEPHSPLQRVILVEESIDQHTSELITLSIDPSFLESRPFYDTDLRKMPELERVPVLQQPTECRPNIDLL